MRPTCGSSAQSHYDLDGCVWSFSPVHKTEVELQAILAAKEKKLQLKAQRQSQQAENLQRKQELREAHKYTEALGRGGWELGHLGKLACGTLVLQEEEPGRYEASPCKG